MRYSIVDVKFVEGLDNRYAKVTFKCSKDNDERVVLFDRYTNEIYDYMIERTGSMYYNGLTSIELPKGMYYGNMSIYLLTQEDVKEFIVAYDETQYHRFIDLYEYYNNNKGLLVSTIRDQIIECKKAIAN